MPDSALSPAALLNFSSVLLFHAEHKSSHPWPAFRFLHWWRMHKIPDPVQPMPWSPPVSFEMLSSDLRSIPAFSDSFHKKRHQSQTHYRPTTRTYGCSNISHQNLPLPPPALHPRSASTLHFRTIDTVPLHREQQQNNIMPLQDQKYFPVLLLYNFHSAEYLLPVLNTMHCSLPPQNNW